jgi:hypothetical protein
VESQTTVSEPPPVALARWMIALPAFTEHLIHVPLPIVALTRTRPLEGPEPLHEVPTSVWVTLVPLLLMKVTLWMLASEVTEYVTADADLDMSSVSAETDTLAEDLPLDDEVWTWQLFWAPVSATTAMTAAVVARTLLRRNPGVRAITHLPGRTSGR